MKKIELGGANQMLNVLKNLLDKVSGKDEERKVDNLIAVIERNKIRGSGVHDIDEVVKFARLQNVRHTLYF